MNTDTSTNASMGMNRNTNTSMGRDMGMNMNTKRFALSFLLAASLLFLGGCSELDDYYALEGSDVQISDFGDTLGFGESACVNTDTDCVCMVCKGEDFDIANPYHWFYDLPLTGGKCWFQEECTEDFFRNNLEGEEGAGFMPFMFGQGSNFAEFSYANAYCNNSARLAVRWLEASEGFDYPLPAHERAECFLDKNVLPMYLLYSNMTAMDASRAARVASEFNGAGPVILSSEFDFYPEDYAAIDLAVEQAFAMKDACPDCMIALSPRLEYNRTLDAEGNERGYSATYEAIDYVFSTYPDAYSKIDLIGVGLNSHYAPNCVGTSLLYDGIDYSKYVLETYGKPSIWAYLLLDEGEYNSGGDQYGTCTWSHSEIVKAYGDVFKYAPALVSNGVLGAAPYSLFGISGPLECENCGMMSVEGELYPQHTAWFSLCQAYYSNRGFLFNVFSPSPCADCSFASNFNLYQLDSFYSGTVPSADELEPVEPADTFYRCNGQLITHFPEEINNFRTAPVIPSESMCSMYPEIDLYADIFDVDPALARAIAWMETGLNGDINGPGGDTCSASQVTSCPNCLTSVSDPDGICNTQSASPPNKYIHSMGIMQVHTYPADQWEFVPGGSVQYEDEALRCGGEDFNPFNRENNVCLGTQIVLDKLQAGKKFVSDNEHELGLNEYEYGSDEYNDMKSAISIFVSAYYYSGASGISGVGGQQYAAGSMEDWAYEFSKQIEVTDAYCDVVSAAGHPCCDDSGEAKTDDCCNNKVFIDYVADCKYPTLPSNAQTKANYGFELLGRYRGLMQTCEQYDAESWRKAIEAYVEEDMKDAQKQGGAQEGGENTQEQETGEEGEEELPADVGLGE